MTTPRLETPTVYEWELSDNATHYERVRASSGPDDLRIMFGASAVVNTIVTISCAILILGIITSRKILSSPFNWYLLFISIPDCLAAFFCFFTCVLSFPEGEYYSEAMCGFQSFYLTWAFTSNTWLNARIVYEIHKLLRFSNCRRRYIPPTRKDVIKQAMAVYLYSTIWGILAGFNFKGFPMESGSIRGFACYPTDKEEQLWFTFGVFTPLTIFIPLMYSVGTMFHIWKNDLLPPEGKRRKISIFLLRVVLVYFFVWGPFLMIHLLSFFIHLNPWANIGVSIGSHFQGMITAVVCYSTDEDLKASIRKVMTCRCCDDSDDLSEPYSSPFFLVSRRFSRRLSATRASFQFGRKRNDLDEFPKENDAQLSGSLQTKSSVAKTSTVVSENLQDSQSPVDEKRVRFMSLQEELDEEQERWDRERAAEESSSEPKNEDLHQGQIAETTQELDGLDRDGAAPAYINEFQSDGEHQGDTHGDERTYSA